MGHRGQLREVLAFNAIEAMDVSFTPNSSTKRTFRQVRVGSTGRHRPFGHACLKGADSVAKVVLPKVSKILRAVGGVFV